MSRHGIVAEYLPWVCGKHPYTLAFQVWLARWARRLSWKEVGRLFHVSWDTVAGAVEAAVQFGLQHRTWGVMESLGFDEVHLGAKRRFWTYQSPTWAGKFLDAWCRRVNRSRLQPLKRVAKTFQRHRELMLNWFRARKPFSNGVVEGFNNKLKLVTKRSYGFRSDYWLEIALYHNLGKLPEPKLTHEFF